MAPGDSAYAWTRCVKWFRHISATATLQLVGLLAQAGALMPIYTAALWPGDRLAHEDPDANKCPHCQQAGLDEVHMFYTCPSLATNRHPMIAQTQHLVDGTKRDNFKPACCDLRGLPY
eukprot:12403384-Karenia_brevis.AAC.1